MARRKGKKGSCALVVQTDTGEDSELYQDLLKAYNNNRPFVNYIYAHYKQPGVIQAMDNAGYKQVKRLGEHTAEDVKEFLQTDDIYMQLSDQYANQEAIAFGTKDSQGQLIEFTNAEDALDKAIQFNNDTSHKGVFAKVIQSADKFNVVIEKVSSINHMDKDAVSLNKQVWDFIKNELRANGIDLLAPQINKEKINATKADKIVDWMYNYSKTSNDLFLVGDIKTLLSFNTRLPQVQRLIQMFGQGQATIDQQLEAVAQQIYDTYRNNVSVTASQKALIDAAMDRSKQFNGVDLNTLNRQVQAMIGNYNTASTEHAIDITLKELHRKYKINNKEIVKLSEDLQTIQDIASAAAMTLQRQVKELKQKEGITDDVKRMNAARKQLLKEIAYNKYLTGLLFFLDEAKNQLVGSATITGLRDQLSGLNTITGNALEKGVQRSKVLIELNKFNKGYISILKAMLSIDKYHTDQDIDTTLMAQIQDVAGQLLKQYNDIAKDIRDTAKATFTDVAVDFIGPKLYNGQFVSDIVEMQDKDSGYMDYLYSMSRVSNPLIVTMSSVVEDMRRKKDRVMRDYSVRMHRERDALRRAGEGDGFMIDENGYIISEYDIPKYNAAKRKAYNNFKYRQRLRGLDLEEAMDNWIEQNTEERVVDHRSGRTERVPNQSYRKPMPTLNAAQQRYYENMMQIKGELGTMLPKYAQRQYVPAQVSRKWRDGMNAALLNNKGIWDMLKQMGRTTYYHKIQNIWKIRNDDPNFYKNGILMGEDVSIVDGDLDNTPFRSIPLFYINKLENQEELLRDFFGGMCRLAGTAINYKHVNEIKDLIEVMGDWISTRGVGARLPGKDGDSKEYQQIESESINVWQRLKKIGRTTNNAALVDAFIDKVIYGVELKNQGKYTKLLKNILFYNSMKSLSANVKGMVNNYLVGEYQMLMEALSGTMMSGLNKFDKNIMRKVFNYKGKPLVKKGAEFYTLSDYIWAHDKMFLYNAPGAIQRLIDFTTGRRNSMPVVLSQFFNPTLDNFEEMANERYYRTWWRALTSKDMKFIGYGIGEHLIHYVTMYAMLHKIKVKINGQSRKLGGISQYNLYDALYVKNKIDGNGELGIKDGVTYELPDGTEVPVDEEFLEQIRSMIKWCNQNSHGSMNQADKGIIHQHLAGRYVMNLRQWMVEHYSRRYRGTHYDASLNNTPEDVDRVREGSFSTVFKVGKNYMKVSAQKMSEVNAVAKFLNCFGVEADRVRADASLRWKNLNAAQQQNVLRVLAELGLLAIVSSFTALMEGGKDDEHHNEWAYKFWLYQMKRLKMDAWSTVPGDRSLNDIINLANNPISATNTINSTLYPFWGFRKDWNQEVSSRTRDAEFWNSMPGKKYAYKTWKHTVPFTKQIEQTIHFDEEENIFKVFEKEFL